ncbi:MAG: ribosome biogenesis/translation initiation ATPase RLI [Candidatus Micrarchaeia archaeon]
MAQRRIAVIERNKCLREKCGYVCKNVCPLVRMGEDCITIDEKGYPVIDENICSGCGICPKKCPASCINVINLAGEEGEPLFQYGPNTFRLYNFAVPKDGAVAALVGRNGIGKTTLLEILSGRMVPNFFEYDRQHTWKDVAARVQNRDLKNYFERMSATHRISYKLQNVELLARAAPDKEVYEALTEFAPKESAEDMIGRLAMGRFAHMRLRDLSGGELQKVAIAIAMLKPANLYFFDEPSVYLDIFERMRVAREISALAEKATVMVVEHDLALLDYLAQYVYVLYGEPGVYGIVSGVKNARAGINEFMEGYLRDENVRFRDRELRIEMHTTSESRNKVMLSYGAMLKKYGKFTLNVEPGEMRKGEVIGVVGPNAIGKSTFVKLIAGAERPDEGEAPAGLKVSYKPQYITFDFDGTVQQYVLERKIDASYVKELELGVISHKPVRSLSGGETQRLAVAEALSASADIYLLDEPSAFLDVEQRMRLSAIIRRDIADKERIALVVDHDIVFVDSISSRIIRFTGESSVHGTASSPSGKVEAMNSFLESLDITLRRDPDTNRPRINKKGSVLDREQRAARNYYYYTSD